MKEQKTTSSFVNNVLGFWSSHPSMLTKQSLVFSLVAFIPLLILLVVCFFLFFNGNYIAFGNLLINHRIAILPFCFLFGFMLTLLMLNMVGKAFGARGGIDSKENLPFPWWMFYVISFFWIVPLVLINFGIVKNSLPRIFLNLFCLMPLIGIVIWCICARPRDYSPKVKFARILFKTFAVMFLCIIVLSILQGIEYSAFHIPFLQKNSWWLILLTLSVPLFFVCLVLSVILKCAKKEKTEEKQEEKMKEVEIPPESGTKVLVPEHVAEIIEKFYEAQISGIDFEGIEEKQIENPSPFQEKNDTVEEKLFAALFCKKQMTLDQAAFLQKFSSAYEDAFEEQFCSSNARSNVNCVKSDILLEGPDGSGRTEALCCAALYSVLIRGHRVLYFVSDKAHADVLVKKLEQKLEEMMFSNYFSCDVLKGEKDVYGWIHGEDKCPPNIVFTTAEDFERNFFFETSEEKRSVLLTYQTILVDDFLELSITERAHMSFIINKLRLLMASEFIMCQSVLVVKPLEKLGQEQLVSRVFGNGMFPSGNALKMRPRNCKPYYLGTFVVIGDSKDGDLLDDACKKIIDVCSNQCKCGTILYNKLLSAEQATKLAETIKQKLNCDIRIYTHLYDFARNSDDQNSNDDVVLYFTLSCGNAAAAIRLNYGDENAPPVFFRIVLEQEKDAASPDSLHEYALLPDETATSLRSWHLRSVFPYIRPLTPIDAHIWSYFGINKNNDTIVDIKGNASGNVFSITWIHDEAPEMSPYLVLKNQSSYSNDGQNIDFAFLPNNQSRIYYNLAISKDDNDELVLAESKTPSALKNIVGQYALWVNDLTSRDELQKTDLAHSEQLTMYIKSKGAIDGFYSNQFGDFPQNRPVLDSQNRPYAVVLQAKHMEGTERDQIIPIRRLKWEFQQQELILSDVNKYGANSSFLSINVEAEKSQLFDIHGFIAGLANRVGRVVYEKQGGFSYNYEAYCSCFVLDPEIDLYDLSQKNETENMRIKQQVRRCISGEWDTDYSCGFSAVLSYLFTAVLRREIPEWSFYTQTLVFYTDGRKDTIGQIMTFLLEPANSGRTASEMLRELLKNEDFEKKLFEGALTLLKQCWNEEKKEHKCDMLRALSICAYIPARIEKAQFEDDCQKATALLERLLRATEEDLKATAKERHDKREKTISQNRYRGKERHYTPSEKEFQEDMVKHLRNFETSFDAARYLKTPYEWDYQHIADLFEDVAWNDPRLFYFSVAYGYQYTTDTQGRTINMRFSGFYFNIRKSELKNAEENLRELTEEALNEIREEDTPEQKALKLHDYLIRRCDYNYDVLKSGDKSSAATVHSALVQRFAICQGYTLAYRYLLNKVHVLSEYMRSDSMNHIWNYVFIPDQTPQKQENVEAKEGDDTTGKWYHVDVTWDDNVHNGEEDDADIKIRYDYFLVSSNKLSSVDPKQPHYGWNLQGLPEAEDTHFDDVDWNKEI